jgi:hypothetical protein
VDTYKTGERKIKVKVKQLENELELTVKKLNIVQYGRSRPTSTSSQKSSGYGKVYSPSPNRNTNTNTNLTNSKRSSSVPSNQRKTQGYYSGAYNKNTPTRRLPYNNPSARQTPPTRTYKPHYSPASRPNANAPGRVPNYLKHTAMSNNKTKNSRSGSRSNHSTI